MTTELSARENLVARVAALRTQLQSKLSWAEENRRLHDETIDALAEAGVFRMRVPRRFGGFESNTRTLVEVGAELGYAGGSIGWTASVYWIPTWMAGLFPLEVQEEIFSTPDVRICGTLSPTATAVPADGGVVVNGRWGFMTGAHHSHWQQIVAILLAPDAAPIPVVGLVPAADLAVADDWHTHGLRGTGSVTTIADNVFVPNDRILPLPVILAGQSPAAVATGSGIHGSPLLPVASASSVGTALGLGAAAKEVFLQRLDGRKITYTDYAGQKDAPLTHHQVANAVMRLDEAGFHSDRLAATVDAKVAADAEWSMIERVQARADMAAACALVKDAVDILAAASGGTSVYTEVPMRRIQQDIHAITLHALMNPTTNTELYGRLLCGLGPNTPYI
jgi:alkylation response protein AidB-like acyl-CoA dehydrogenase